MGIDLAIGRHGRLVGCALAFVLGACNSGRSPQAALSPGQGPGPAATATPARPLAPSSRSMAWFLGKQLSLAAVGDASGAPEAAVAEAMSRARRLAEALGTTILDLPPRQASRAKHSAAVLAYLLGAPGKALRAHIEKRYGSQHAALFEMAVKSNVLLLLYAPGDELGEATASGVSDAGRKAGLPNTTWGGLVVTVTLKGSHGEVKEKVFQMQRQIEAHLKADA